MKKLITVVFIVTLLLQPMSTIAEKNNAGYEGGIHKNERDYRDLKQYKEMIFLSGQPILLKGTVEIDVDEDELVYTYELNSDDGSATLEREIELERIIDNTSHAKQTIEENNILDYDETITVDGQNLELVEYQFHNSSVDDAQPVVNYYKGDWLGTKRYTINGDQGEVIVDITGDIYGYDHQWGATETQKIHRDITYRETIGEEPLEWFGYVDLDISFNRTKRMEYFNNLPYQTSFSNGYTLTEQEETIMSYDYNLPALDNTGETLDLRNKGKGQERFETLPTQRKLFITKYEDIKGHWAEKDIMRISGLKITNQEQKYFGPGLSTHRVDFARWITIAMNLVEKEEEVQRSYTKPDDTPSIFSDISKDNPDYVYIEAIKENGIMNGVGDNKFSPKGRLTRAEAITTLIRALGLEGLAPTGDFQTRFKDDEYIPAWARRSIYVADKIGLATGTLEGYLYPRDYMTKAEAAAFLNRFINYLQGIEERL